WSAFSRSGPVWSCLIRFQLIWAGRIWFDPVKTGLSRSKRV
ncbi:hypothetical protein CP02DC21_1511, partial [Chlamydia psittaci 02DC21]